MIRFLTLLCALLFVGVQNVSAQTILDFEAPATSTTFQYFASAIDGQLTATIANPNPTGLNTSATVLEFKKPAGPATLTYAGAFSNPNPTTPVNVISNTQISIKVHFDHIGSLTLKLEGSPDGGTDWVQTVANTKVNEWETLTFNTTIPSIEGVNAPASGHIYNRVVLFTDFGSVPTADQVTYIDDIKVETAITCTTILNYETPASSTTFQYFGSSLEPGLTSSIPNPNPTGLNTSATVLEFKKPANSMVWAGAYSNPNASTPINLLAGGKIRVKFHTDHPGNLTFKLEEGQNGAPNWVVTVPNSVVNEWVVLEFDPALPSIEGPNLPASGGVYSKIVLFADFQQAFTTPQVYYIDDIEVCSSGGVQSKDVTFKVDMNQYAGTYSKVYVSGTFNTFSGDANELLDADGDKIFETKISLPVGSYEYKFTLDNFAAQEQFAQTSACTNTTIDGANIYTNRKLVVSAETTVGPVCFNSCYGCGDGVKITYNLGMGMATADPGGVYLAGGLEFGAPGGRFKMTDPDNDGVFSIQIERQKGYGGYYTFTNGPCADFSCKENIGGQPCANPNNFNDRLLAPVQKDTVVATCFGVCSTNTACTIGTNDLPLSSDWMTLTPSLASEAVRLGFTTPVIGSVRIQLVDATGKIVLSETRSDVYDNYLMPVAHLSNGLYFLLVQSADKAASGRFVKQD